MLVDLDTQISKNVKLLESSKILSEMTIVGVRLYVPFHFFKQARVCLKFLKDLLRLILKKYFPTL